MAIDPNRFDALLRLNNEHAAELSRLTADRFNELAAQALVAQAVDEDAFVFAFDENVDYDSPNFRWFRPRYRRFVYVDRVVVSAGRRGEGLAKRLYGAVFAAARAAGHERVVCEVNIDPPNPVSDAFHVRLGFREVGSASIHDGRKTVRYLELAL